MEYRTLGRTGVRVSPLCLGAMAFSHENEAEGIRVVHRALDAGINFIDTADRYSSGQSEEMLGKALKGRRDDVVLATKFHLPMGEDVNQRGNSRRWIMRAVEGSLKRLQTDYVDLYQAHRPDGDVEETLSALTDLVRQGKVRYLGSSTFPASQIVEAQWVARERRLERFVCEQPPYSILVRGIENGVLPTTLRHGMAVIPWSPLAGGWLSGKYRKGATFESRRMQYMRDRFDYTLPHNARKLEAADALGALADEAGIPLVELALTWVITHPGITAAIVGARTVEHLEGQLPAASRALDAALLDRIDEIVPPGTNFRPADDGYDNPALDARATRR